MATSQRSCSRAWAKVAALTAEALAWSLLSWGVWLLTLSAIDAEDLLVGGLCGTACGVVAVATRRLYGARWRPTMADARPALLLPLAVVVDAVAVLAVPWRRRPPHATIERTPIDAQGAGARAAARRALATIVTSASPASVVLDADPESGELVVHTLASPGPSLHRHFARR